MPKCIQAYGHIGLWAYKPIDLLGYQSNNPGHFGVDTSYMCHYGVLAARAVTRKIVHISLHAFSERNIIVTKNEATIASMLVFSFPLASLCLL